jgi:hypothetical protein
MNRILEALSEIDNDGTISLLKMMEIYSKTDPDTWVKLDGGVAEISLPIPAYLLTCFAQIMEPNLVIRNLVACMQIGMVQWIEQNLNNNAELKKKFDYISQIQAQLRPKEVKVNGKGILQGRDRKDHAREQGAS